MYEFEQPTAVKQIRVLFVSSAFVSTCIFWQNVTQLAFRYKNKAVHK